MWSTMMRNVIQRHMCKIENQLARITSPLVWLFSMAPAFVNNAITAFVVALVVLFVFHSGLMIANTAGFHAMLMYLIGVNL